MTDKQTLANTEATDAQATQAENQANTAKSYTQEEVDNMMARMRGSLEKKLLKPYEDLGDPAELRQIREEYTKRQQAEQIKRGEFEKTLQELAAKKDAEIQKRDSIIKEYKVNTPLLNAAAANRAVAPEQVRQLLSHNVRLNEEGEVEVVDTKGVVRYDDKGRPLAVEDLVREFLDSNPHFRSAAPATTNTRTMITPGTQQKLDIAGLDMTKPEHRKLYKEYRKTAGLA